MQSDFAVDQGFRAGASADDCRFDPSDLETRRAQIASRLNALPPGPVVYHGSQSLDAFVLFAAAWRAGRPFAAVDETWPRYMLAQAAGALRPALVATSVRGMVDAAAVFPTAEVTALDTSQISPFIAEMPVEEPPAARPQDPATYIFTSGSSGPPKTVVLSRAAVLSGARLTLETFGWQAGERLVNLPDPHTMSGLRNAFLAAPLAGMSWIPIPSSQRSDIFALLDRLAQARPHRLVCGPQLLRQISLLGERAPAAIFGDLKAVYCTGASLDAEAASRFFEQHRVPVINYYGLTETGGLCLSQSLDDWRPGDHTLGRPVGCDVRLNASWEAGITANTGELQVRSAQLMSGYLDDPVASAARMDGEWLRTGDIARRLPDGRYELVGRADHFIKTLSTDRVHPEEIERVLERHEAVAEAAVFGRPEPGGGERIVALVAARPGQTLPDDLVSRLPGFVADHLGASRAPSVVRVVEALPRHGNGKIIRHRLGEMLD